MKSLNELAAEMKRDWDERARENAKWFINTFKVEQTEAEFEASCLNDMRVNVQAVLPTLTWGRAARALRLLEIGCGIGRMTAPLAHLFGEVHGVDVSGEMIRQGRERLKHLSNVFFYETNGIDFSSFPPDYFEIIFSAYVFQHLPDQEVIRANLRDAYRVLAPGGVIRFASAGVTNSAYEAMEKNTWTGASFAESDSRQIARELGAQLVSLHGSGTQYFWTMLRKPLPAESPQAPLKMQAVGRADNFAVKEIPTRGEQALLGLAITGLSAESVDCNNLSVEWQGKITYPIYVGPEFQTSTNNQGEAIIIKLPVPTDLTDGVTEIRLNLPGGTSLSATINIVPSPIAPPVMMQYSNALDAGLDIHTTGPKSVIRVFALGLEGAVTVENTLIHLGELALRPAVVSFLPANGAWEIRAQLPSGTPAQTTHISVSHEGRRSLTEPLVIQE